MKRIILCLLTVTMLVSCFALASCENRKEPEKNPENTLDNVLQNGEKNPNEVLDLPTDLNYGGDKFTVLTYNSMVDEFGDSESEKPDPIEEALFTRDSYIEEKLDIEFAYKRMNGQFQDKETFSSTVRTSIQGGSKAWDLVGTYSMIAPNLALNGVLTDLATLEYTDFSKAWYPQFMLDASTINNKTYFITGDMSTNVLYAMQGVVFSSTQANARGINEAELYQMVYDNEWTLDALFALCEELGTELGGDGVWDDTDFYPIVTSNDGCIDSFYFSTGLTLINEDEDGKLFISDDVLSEKVLLLHGLVYDAKQTFKSYHDTDNEKTIMENRCIFSISPMINFRLHWADATEQYRILPFPKFEAGTTSKYQTFLSMWHTQYCIPNDIDDIERSAAVMEYLGYASYNYVTPVVFEETMKLRYSVNEDCSNMFDIMRDGRTYDTASLFYMSFTPGVYYDAHSMFRNAILGNVTNWTSHYRGTYEAGLVAVTKQLNEFYGVK